MKTYQLTIKGRCPSKKNSRINTRSGRSFPSKKYKEWHEQASWQLYTQEKPLNVEHCTVELYFHAPDKRRWDLTNKAESIMDLLVDNGILKDDNAHVVSKLTLVNCGFDKKDPRVIIMIKVQ